MADMTPLSDEQVRSLRRFIIEDVMHLSGGQLQGILDALEELLHLRAQRMVWTDAVPTEPGYYWLKQDGQVVLRRVDMDTEGKLMAAPPGCEWMAVERINGQWAGPIPAPAEPKAAP